MKAIRMIGDVGPSLASFGWVRDDRGEPRYRVSAGETAETIAGTWLESTARANELKNGEPVAAGDVLTMPLDALAKAQLLGVLSGTPKRTRRARTIGAIMGSGAFTIPEVDIVGYPLDDPRSSVNSPDPAYVPGAIPPFVPGVMAPSTPAPPAGTSTMPKTAADWLTWAKANWMTVAGVSVGVVGVAMVTHQVHEYYLAQSAPAQPRRTARA